jgi:hypothetical protein
MAPGSRPECPDSAPARDPAALKPKTRRWSQRLSSIRFSLTGANFSRGSFAGGNLCVASPSEKRYSLSIIKQSTSGLEAAQSLAWLQNASRRDATKFRGALKISGKPVPVRAARAAHDAPVKIVTRMTGSIVPRPIVGHRAFNAKGSPIMVGDNEEERRRGIGVGRGWASDDSEVRCGHSASIRPK